MSREKDAEAEVRRQDITWTEAERMVQSQEGWRDVMSSMAFVPLGPQKVK